MGEDDARKIDANEQGGSSTELPDEEVQAIKESQEDPDTADKDDPEAG